MNASTAPAHAAVASAERRRAALAWAAAVVVAAALIAATRFTSRDPDSAVYAGLSARLAAEPLQRWIAPEWWGHWGFEGPFREHPIGILLLPAALGRLGYPAPQAAYAVNACFQAVSFVLIGALAAFVVTRREARALTWVLQLILIAFVFRIRANQEYAVLAGILAALYATERSRERPAWAWLTAAAFAWVLLVKGVFGLIVPLLCALWLLARWAGGADDHPGVTRRAWIALGATLAVLPVVAGGYEWLYQRATGDSFLAFYTGPRLNPDAVVSNVWLRWPINFGWYIGRLIWYAMPWSPFALGLGWLWARGRFVPDSRTRGALLFALCASAALLAAFAAADRRADRFIFPAYFAIGAAGAVAAIRWSPRLSRVVERLDRPWVPATFWIGLFLLRLVSGAHLPRLATG
ncbi:MAG TPA: hypothetical protein VNK41_05770 [Vicinamibacterales bacterium]|nr:hypothetical protein [Vicinamibacterales bacterium]